MVKKSVSAILSTSPLFASLSESEVKSITCASVIVEYLRNETIYKQGALGGNVVLIADGYGKIYHEGSGEKNVILSIVGKGYVAGLETLYDQNRNRYSVAAVNGCTVLEIPKSVLLTLVAESIDFAKHTILSLSSSANLCYTKMIAMATKQLHGRLATAILYLSDDVSASDNIEIGLSRKEIAELAGISTEGVIRILSELNNDGIICLDGKSIIIKKRNLLTKLAEIG